MKNSVVCLLIFMVLLPACSSKKKKAAKVQDKNNTVLVEQDAKTHEKGKKSLFLDDSVDEYALDDEAGSFSANSLKDAKHLALVESAQSREWEERKEEQSKHGLKKIYFDFDQYSLRPDQNGVLQHDLARVKKLTEQGHKIVIEGHSCKFGAEDYNMHLSESRAKVVKDYFVKHGVSANMLQTVGRGFEMCVVSSGTQEQQAPNRRVELYVVS